MLEKLSNALRKATDKIASAIFVDKALIDGIIKELQRALIEADVNVLFVKQLSEKIRQAAIDERIKGVEKREHIIKLLHDEILAMVGGKKQELEFKKSKLQKVLLLGTYGVGKTTTISKLANFYSKRGFKTCMLGLDIHRPAAMEQLEQLAKRNNLTAFIDKTEKSSLKIYEKYKKELENYEIVFIDTAGRHTLDSDLVKEIKQLDKEIEADYSILVIPADIGQAAKKLASEFQDACKINGVIITRMDSSAKGGGALTACSETKAPVFFITTGEHIHDIELFNPSSFISRILGLGDLEALIEKVKSAVDEKKQEKIAERLKEGKFTLLDLYEQLKSMEGIGSLDKITSLIPGLGGKKLPDELLGTQEKKMKHWKHAINSMTREEIEAPELLEKQTSRIARVARGSGTTTSDIRALLKQCKLIKEVVKTGNIQDFSPEQGLSQKQLMKLAKKFGKKIRI